LIDRLRHDIQERLEQLRDEAERLGRALVALDPRHKSTADAPPARPRRRTATAPKRSTAPARAATTAKAAKPPSPDGEVATGESPASAPAPTSSKTAGPATATRARASAAQGRTARGATKTKVLEALAKGDAMTAGEVATATGLGRATVSTTLSKLAKSGEVKKAERGYQLPKADGSA
jgi:DNA-binding transcriptional ArsR family regulator